MNIFWNHTLLGKEPILQLYVQIVSEEHSVHKIVHSHTESPHHLGNISFGGCQMAEFCTIDIQQLL